MKVLTVILALVVTILAGMVYLGALDGPFVYDDHRTVVTNPSLRDPGNIRALLSYERFRPLVNVTYAFDYALWELEPKGYHITSIALHMVHVLLFFLTARAIFQDQRRTRKSDKSDSSDLWPAFAAAALFAVHPMMTEAVAYVSGRSEVLCGVFFLGAFLLVRGFLLHGGAARLVPGLMCFVLAVASKEVGAMFPFVIALYDALFLANDDSRRRRFLRFHLPFAGLMLLAGLVRLVLFFRVETPDLPRPVWQNVITEWEVIWRYLTLLVYPSGQTIAHPVRPAASPWDAGAWLDGGALVALIAVAFLLRRHLPLLLFGLAWFLLLLAPSSTLIPLQELMSEHRVYAASCGFFLAIAALGSRLAAGARSRAAAAFVVLGAAVLVLALATRERHRSWSDPVLLWGEAADHEPLTWRAAYGLGEALRNAGRCDEAVPLLEQAAGFVPEHLDTRMNLGICLAQSGAYEEARKAFSAALEIDPKFVKALNNLGRLAAVRGDTARAEEYFQHSLREDPKNVLARLNLIDIYSRSGRPDEEIRRLCGEVAALDPSAPRMEACQGGR